MENKKKPSLVVAVPNCDDFDYLGLAISPEMLTWTIGQYQEDPFGDSEQIRKEILRTVLKALMNLSPFYAVISLVIDEDKKIINYGYRVWLQIRLEGQPVLTLNYHSKRQNEAYFEPADWLEIDMKPNQTKEEWNEAMLEILTTAQKMTTEEWVGFFKKRILDRALFLREKAKRKIEDATALEESGHKILLNLL